MDELSNRQETKPGYWQSPPVDAVIAWVDGSDADHTRNRLAHMSKEGHLLSRLNNGTYATRFVEQGEIYYCIASILKYAPFIRTIYVVTDGQKPRFFDDFQACGLCDAQKIKLVDHRDVFRGHEDVLPTFNSLTIESMLWNIEGISEHFLYFNDDFFLNSPLEAGYFLLPDGKMRLIGQLSTIWPRYLKYRLKVLRNKAKGNLYPEPHFKTSQMLSARQLGLKKYLRIHHMPYVISRDALKSFFADHPDVLQEQIRHRFRDLTQFLPAGLSNHLAIQAGTADIRDEPCCAYIEPSSPPEAETQALTDIRNESLPFGCIQSLDCYEHRKQQFFHKLLTQKFKGFLPPTLPVHRFPISPSVDLPEQPPVIPDSPSMALNPQPH